jgi:hypothetical protein
VRRVFYLEALREALRDEITAQAEGEFADYFVPGEDIWAEARHILISFPQGEVIPEGDGNPYFERAQAIVEALNGGASFAALALAESGDPGSAARGGNLGWAATSNYVPEFKEAVETQAIGAIGAPVRSQFGYHIIQVLDREARAVTENDLKERREQKFQEWLELQRGSGDFSIERRENWQELIPERPDYNDLLSDILPRYDPQDGIQIPTARPRQ